MSVVHRERDLRAARAKATVVALYRSELQQAGEARKAALAESDRQLDRIGTFLPGATAAGLSLSEISRITGISRPTLYELLKRGERTGDPRFDLLAALGGSGPLKLEDLAGAIAKPEAFVERLVRALVAQEFVGLDREGDPESAYQLTAAGEEALLSWEFRTTMDERTSQPMRAAMALFRYSPDELAEIEDKIALAEANGQSRLTLGEALRMGVKNTVDELLAAAGKDARARRGSDKK